MSCTIQLLCYDHSPVAAVVVVTVVVVVVVEDVVVDVVVVDVIEAVVLIWVMEVAVVVDIAVEWLSKERKIYENQIIIEITEVKYDLIFIKTHNYELPSLHGAIPHSDLILEPQHAFSPPGPS